MCRVLSTSSSSSISSLLNSLELLPLDFPNLLTSCVGLSVAQHLLGGELKHGVDPRVDHISLELDQGLDQLLRPSPMIFGIIIRTATPNIVTFSFQAEHFNLCVIYDAVCVWMSAQTMNSAVFSTELLLIDEVDCFSLFIVFFIGPRYTWAPIYGTGCLKLYLVLT